MWLALARYPYSTLSKIGVYKPRDGHTDYRWGLVAAGFAARGYCTVRTEKCPVPQGMMSMGRDLQAPEGSLLPSVAIGNAAPARRWVGGHRTGDHRALGG
jgi:hypothetical protein